MLYFILHWDSASHQSLPIHLMLLTPSACNALYIPVLRFSGYFVNEGALSIPIPEGLSDYSPQIFPESPYFPHLLIPTLHVLSSYVLSWWPIIPLTSLVSQGMTSQWRDWRREGGEWRTRTGSLGAVPAHHLTELKYDMAGK